MGTMNREPMPQICQECGMLCGPLEYHPYAACLMFKACHDGDRVRANLQAVKDDAKEEAARCNLCGWAKGHDIGCPNDGSHP